MQASTLSEVAKTSVQSDPRKLLQQLRQVTAGLSAKKKKEIDQICHQLAELLHVTEDPFAELKSFGNSLDEILPHRKKAEPLLILSTIAFQLELRGEPHNSVEQMVCAISSFLSEMSAGGFIEYLESAAGDYAHHLPDLLETLGADKHLILINQVVDLLSELPPEDHDDRVVLMDQMMAEQTVEQWQALNKQYHELEEPLAAIAMQYVEQHKDKIRL